MIRFRSPKPHRTGQLIHSPLRQIIPAADKHHTAERRARDKQSLIMMHGGANGFFRGKTTELFADMMELKPDIFPCVPRLANMLYDKVL